MQRVQTKGKILIVDTEPYNLDILTDYLSKFPYQIIRARSGEEAWEQLTQAPEGFRTILLDQALSDIDGMSMIRRIRNHGELKTVPVILQAMQPSKQDILEGLEAGASFFLPMPYTQEKLMHLFANAMNWHSHMLQLRETLYREQNSLSLMLSSSFRIQTLEQASSLSTTMANTCPNPERVVLGLSELLINGIEHGNLEIGYAEKTLLINKGIWLQEIEKRIVTPQYRHRFVRLDFVKTDASIAFIVEDQGKGFDWENYMGYDPARAFDTHGRGIMTANAFSFDALEYQNQGRTVIATIMLSE